MSDLDAEHMHYPIMKAEYDELTAWARNAGYTDDEIRSLHHNASTMAAALGGSHYGYFHLIMRLNKPEAISNRPSYCCGKCPPTIGGGYDCTCKGNPRCTESTRLSIAWANFKDALLAPFEEIHHKIIMWNWKRKEYMRKSYPWKGQDD